LVGHTSMAEVPKDRNIAKIVRRAGYGGIFILTGKEYPSIVTAAQTGGEGSRERREKCGNIKRFMSR